MKGSQSREQSERIYLDLPLLSPSRPDWAERAAGRLDIFLADHAVCEQQAALTALNLVAHYPEDDELVERMTGLAAEEVTHLRRVTTLMRRRGLRLMRRRPNPYVRGLRERVRSQAEPRLKIDRLVVGTLIEARSCERFSKLLEVIDTRDAEVADLLADLGPAERRHWVMFHRLAAREAEPVWFETHWREWLEYEDRLIAERGDSPRVHG